MPQIRVSATPLHIRADVLAKVLRIETANVVLFEWIEFVTLAEIPFFSDEAIFEIQKVLDDTANLVELVELAVSHTRADAALFSDEETRNIGKVLADAAALSDAATLILAKVLSDTAIATDAATVSVAKPLDDSSSFTDDRINHFTKVAFSGYAIDYFLEDYTEPTDYVYAQDAHVFAFAKTLADAFSATDDVNGVLADDDQIIGFFKSIDHVTQFTDAIAFAAANVLADGAVVTDSPAIALDRPLSDSSALTDAAVLSIGLTASEAANFTDARQGAFGKILADGSTVSESVRLGFGLVASDGASFTDGQIFAVGLGLSETPGFADAIQFAGAKSLADAGSVSESAALQFFRPASDSFSITENNVLAFGLGPSDTATFTDSGELLNQDYTEAFYFAEDYVGTSRTF
jgi:hypothetical protein